MELYNMIRDGLQEGKFIFHREILSTHVITNLSSMKLLKNISILVVHTEE